jgi:16S rRNA processing protein RimM
MLTIGEIVAAHGLRGGLRIQPHTDFPERFAELTRVWIARPDGTRRQYDVRRTQIHETHAQVILGLRGITSRNAAQEFIGCTVEIEDNEAVALPDGTYFEHDIIGLEVVTTGGLALGKITEILRTGANDVYVTPKALIPAIPDVVKEVDLAGRRMVIEAVPGLLEE